MNSGIGAAVLLALALVAGGCVEVELLKDCEEACGGSRPYCSPVIGKCVECHPSSETEDCGPRGVCVVTADDAFCNECRDPDPYGHGVVPCADGVCVDGACVECGADADCGGEAPRCERELAACVECLPGTQAVDCDEATPRCDPLSFSCVKCSPQTETEDCGDNACDLLARECGTVKRGTLLRAQACRADTECQNGACVQVTFAGEPSEFVCLRRAADGCSGAFRSVTAERESRSGAAPTKYCGWNETAVSAEAMRALDEGRECATDTDCGPGGLCRDLEVGRVCTIPCEQHSDCPASGSWAGCYDPGHCGTPL